MQWNFNILLYQVYLDLDLNATHTPSHANFVQYVWTKILAAYTIN